MKKVLISVLATVAALIAFPGCGHAPLAGGGGTDWEARNVAGKAVYSNGTPAVGAIVVLRPDTFRADLPSALRKSTQVSPVAIVDKEGRFKFDSVSPGSYGMEVVDLRSGVPAQASFAMVSIPESDSIISLGTTTLRLTGSLTGSIDRSPVGSSTPLFVRIFGLNRIVEVDSAGAFEIPNLAPADYLLEILSVQRVVIPRSISVTAISESTLTIPKIIPFVDHLVDAVIVRGILDSLGLTDVRIEAVSSTRDGRVVDLNFRNYPDITGVPPEVGNLSTLTSLWVTGNNVTSLPSTIGQLSELRYLNISGSAIRELPPEIGRCKKLHHIQAIRAQLVSLPDSIVGCVSLDTLEINDNQISSLPESMVYLPRLTGLNLSNNRVCAVSTTLKAWLDRKMPGWSYTQRCP